MEGPRGPSGGAMRGGAPQRQAPQERRGGHDGRA
jgi:hypothetical protein